MKRNHDDEVSFSPNHYRVASSSGSRNAPPTGSCRRTDREIDEFLQALPGVDAPAAPILRSSVPSMYRSVVEGDVDLGPRFDQRRFAKEMQRFNMELAAAGVDASS